MTTKSSSKNLNEKYHWKYLNVDGRITIKWILTKLGVRCGWHSTGPGGEGPVATAANIETSCPVPQKAENLLPS
jgi:hypothetical protein